MAHQASQLPPACVGVCVAGGRGSARTPPQGASETPCMHSLLHLLNPCTCCVLHPDFVHAGGSSSQGGPAEQPQGDGAATMDVLIYGGFSGEAVEGDVIKIDGRVGEAVGPPRVPLYCLSPWSMLSWAFDMTLHVHVLKHT